MTARIKWTLLPLITLFGFLADWWTKKMAVAQLPYGEGVPVFAPYLQWTLVYNKGMLFGLNPRMLHPDFPTNLFFYVFTAVAVVLLLAYYKSKEIHSLFGCLGICLIMPGALGNLWDRVVRPADGVVDFIRMGLSETLYWPIYNLADVWIFFGVVLLILDMWFRDHSTPSVADYVPPVSNDTGAAQ